MVINEELYQQMYEEEIQFQDFDHQNIVKVYKTEDQKTERGLYFILMEYCDGGNLHNYIRRQENNHLTFNQTLYFLDQIVSGLEYIHVEKNFMHRDIKPSNILLKKTENGSYILKIADFGTLKKQEQNQHTIKRGTKQYMSPQVKFKENQNEQNNNQAPYSKKADIYSLAITTLQMLYKVSFERSRKRETLELKKELKQPFNFEQYNDIQQIDDQNFKDLIQDMQLYYEEQTSVNNQIIQNNPRPSIVEVRSRLNQILEAHQQQYQQQQQQQQELPQQQQQQLQEQTQQQLQEQPQQQQQQQDLQGESQQQETNQTYQIYKTELSHQASE